METMRHRRYQSSLLAVVLCASLAAAACSGDDDAARQEPDDRTEQPTTGDADPSCSGESDGTLTLGGLTPQSGALSHLGPPQAAGAELAVSDINTAGGVLGEPITFLPGDSGDTGSQVASSTVDDHLAAGADAIIGAAPSDQVQSVLDQITDACAIQFSPRTGSEQISGDADDDLYFTTAPSDVLLGQALANLMIEDGNSSAAFLALQGTYGEGLLDITTELFEDQGGEVVVARTHDAGTEAFETEIEAVIAQDPDALVVIGLDETGRILDALFERGFTPDTKAIYLADGGIGTDLAEAITQPGALYGVKGILPAAELSDAFRTRLLTVDPTLVDFVSSGETYDAIVVTALAATIAGSDDPAAIAAHINSVTRDGETCIAFTDCRDLIERGDDIDYDGQSGRLEFSRQGEPTIAGFAVLSYAQDSNVIDPDATEYRQVSL